jgi:hypothetical protein
LLNNNELFKNLVHRQELERLIEQWKILRKMRKIKQIFKP